VSLTEREYIVRCKWLIEEKFHFQHSDDTLRQRDLEYLADVIEDRSGIKLSLSTLKRLWKKDYDQKPHPSTLDALAAVLDYKDWHAFKTENIPVDPPAIASNVSVKKSRRPQRWMVVLVAAALVTLFWTIAFRTGGPAKTKPVVKGPVTFTGNKTVTKGVPNTIIFNYDVSNVEADSFFFQQAWNEQEKVKIDPKGHHYSNIYYYPGYHKAKLIANDSVIRRFPVHVTTDGWMPLVRYTYTDNIPVYLKKDYPATKGELHVTRNDLLSSKVDVSGREFVLSYYNVREFEDTYSDHFTLDTRIVCDSSNEVPCPAFELVILCEAHIFYVRIMGKGCERNAGIKMGEVVHDGSDHDLSALGRNLHEWQDLQVRVEQKKATIYLDKQPVYSIGFKGDFGRVVGLTYNFLGTGAIDYVALKNGKNKLVYQEDFDK